MLLRNMRLKSVNATRSFINNNTYCCGTLSSSLLRKKCRPCAEMSIARCIILHLTTLQLSPLRGGGPIKYYYFPRNYTQYYAM
jgi:hypothetical protein